VVLLFAAKATDHYTLNVLLLLFAAKTAGHCALQSVVVVVVVVVCSQSNLSRFITKCCCCLQPKQLVTVHYKDLCLLFLFLWLWLFAAKANGHYTLQSVAVVGSQSSLSLCITKGCCCLQSKQLVTVHYKGLLLSAV
jgi:hypothetical protein